jgi:hypothetical protein
MDKLTYEFLRRVDLSDTEQLALNAAKNEAGVVKYYQEPSSFTKHTKSEIFNRSVKKIVDTLIYTEQVKEMEDNWSYIIKNKYPLEKYIKSKYGNKMRRIISKIVDEEEKYTNDYYYGRTTDIREHITRIKQILLNEQVSEITAKASVDGFINFFDKTNEKVYRYKLNARITSNQSIDVFVKSLNDKTGDLIFINPQSEEEESYVIPMEQLEKIKSDSPKKQTIQNIFNFKKFGKTITINLIFVEEKRFSIVR